MIDNDTSLNSFQSQPWSETVLKLPEFKRTIRQQSAYLTYSTRIKLRDTPHCNSMNLEGLVYASTHTQNAATASAVILSIVIAALVAGIAFYYKQLRSSDQIQKVFKIIYVGFGGIGIMTMIASIILLIEEGNVDSVRAYIHKITGNHCFYDSSIDKIFDDLTSKWGSAASIFNLWIAEGVICALSLMFSFLVNKFYSRR